MRIAKVVVLLVVTMFFSLAQAGEIKPYSQADFDKLSAAGKPIVLAIHASWCPTCKIQKPIQSDLMSSPAYKDVTMFTIDFDSDKPLLKKFKVSMQSTMVGFKGKKEVSRSVGDTSREGIETIFKKTVL